MVTGEVMMLSLARWVYENPESLWVEFGGSADGPSVGGGELR